MGWNALSLRKDLRQTDELLLHTQSGKKFSQPSHARWEIIPKKSLHPLFLSIVSFELWKSI